ncbi:MAG: hypothetical protein KDB21_07260 [Acidimicrobiales bacterium]|nr:hypothetical protein [Acidimicrobiales bacterium]
MASPTPPNSRVATGSAAIRSRLRLVLVALLALASVLAAGCERHASVTTTPAGVTGRGEAGVRVSAEVGAELANWFFLSGDVVVVDEQRAADAVAIARRELPVAATSWGSEVVDRWEDYDRQLAGVLRDDVTLVLVNAFCDSLGSDPLSEPVMVLDGGACFWFVLVDVSTGAIVDSGVNGDA